MEYSKKWVSVSTSSNGIKQTTSNTVEVEESLNNEWLDAELTAKASLQLKSKKMYECLTWILKAFPCNNHSIIRGITYIASSGGSFRCHCCCLGSSCTWIECRSDIWKNLSVGLISARTSSVRVSRS